MEAKLEKIENSEAYISVALDEVMMEEGMQQAYRKVVKQLNIPGFRKGRAPRQLLEAYYGKEILYQDALEYLVPEAYQQALDELDITPVAQPDFEINEIEEGQPMVFSVKVAVKPEVGLGTLEQLEVKIPKMEVLEDDVESRLQNIRERYALVAEKVDEPAESGDMLTLDFTGYIDGSAFEGGSGQNYSLELGSNTFIPGFEAQLIGIKTGEIRQVQVDFPSDYHVENLAGAAAEFEVLVHKIETKKLRELDDDFAQEVSEFNTMAEFREDVKNSLVQMLENRKKELLKQEVLDKALAECDIMVAEAMVNEQIERMKDQFSRRLTSQGLTMEQYFQFTGSSDEDLMNDMRPEAERTIKVNLMLEKIVDEKGFAITDEEVNKQIEEVAANMSVEVDQVKQNLSGIMGDFEYSMKCDKAVAYLIENAIIIEAEEVLEFQENEKE